MPALAVGPAGAPPSSTAGVAGLRSPTFHGTYQPPRRGEPSFYVAAFSHQIP